MQCKRCDKTYIEEPETDNEGSGLCYFCFEVSLEEYEERRRERIAEQNEY